MERVRRAAAGMEVDMISPNYLSPEVQGNPFGGVGMEGHGDRGANIVKYAKEHGITNYVIFDDDPKHVPQGTEAFTHFVLTKHDIALTLGTYILLPFH